MPDPRDHWAWKIFPRSPRFFIEYLHGVPLAMRDISDPRAGVSDGSEPTTPTTTSEAAFIFGDEPKKTDSTKERRKEVIITHDINAVAMDRNELVFVLISTGVVILETYNNSGSAGEIEAPTELLVILPKVPDSRLFKNQSGIIS
jgi:hypothetical protein